MSVDQQPVHCPDKLTPIKNRHPRVFIPMNNGKGICPYCGTTYKIVSAK